MDLGPALPPAPDRSQAPLLIKARELDASETRESRLSGNVELFRADQHISTEQVIFDPVAQTVTLPVAMSYRDQQVWLDAENGEYSFTDETGSFSLIDYGLSGSSANGNAEFAELIGGKQSRLQGIDYTSCPEEKQDWILYAKELEFQHEEGWGKARGAKLKFKGIRSGVHIDRARHLTAIGRKISW